MPRIYLPASDMAGANITITDEKSHYLISVLRCHKGDELIIFDGKGDCFKTRIVKVDKREVITEVIEKFTCDMESPLNIILVQGLIKGEKMDMIVQKTTELGVKKIIPVITKRSQLRETKKVTRWRKIAEEAARQCGRSIVTDVQESIRFDDLFQNVPEKKSGLIFYEEAKGTLSETVGILKTKRGEWGGEIYIVIGPEGGFTKEEITLAHNNGLLITCIGKRILRAETAAISAVALIQFLLGDIR
jgi:16S rRNA (uracil1498-N3)-methyltransferase